MRSFEVPMALRKPLSCHLAYPSLNSRNKTDMFNAVASAARRRYLPMLFSVGLRAENFIFRAGVGGAMGYPRGIHFGEMKAMSVFGLGPNKLLFLNVRARRRVFRPEGGGVSPQ